MAHRDRRRAARAALILILATIAGLLWREAGDAVVQADGPSGSAGLESPAPPPEPGLGSRFESGAVGVLRVEPDAALESAVRRAIATWVAEAERRSQGRAHAGNVDVAVVVRELGGAELVSIEPDRALAPASNMKLVTTATALVLLGADWSLETRFEGAGQLDGGRLTGDLVVRAGGDPFYAPAGDGRSEERLAQVARDLRAAGLRRVDGDLVLARDGFPSPGPGPGWPPASQYWTESCALAAGLTVNGAVIEARVTPGAAGAAARIEVHPEPHGLSRNYGVETVAGTVNDVRVGATVSAVTVKGRVGARCDTVEAGFAHPDPEGLFAAVLRDQLGRAGIEVRGGTRVVDTAEPGLLLATTSSPALSLLEPINTHSANSVADQLFFATARAVVGAGTRSAGRLATALALERLGVSDEGLFQVDGSGLSRDNRISARQLTALLDAVLGLDRETGEAYLDSLALAGRTGTLSERMRGGPAEGRVRAKTGWISGASALSGLAWTVDGRQLVFSLLVSYPREVPGMNTHCFKPLGDDIAAILVGGAQ